MNAELQRGIDRRQIGAVITSSQNADIINLSIKTLLDQEMICLLGLIRDYIVRNPGHPCLTYKSLISKSITSIVQELDARCFILAIAAVLDKITLHLHRKASRHGMAQCTTNKATIFTIIANIIAGNFSEEILNNSLTALETATRRAENKRPGRYVPRKTKMFAIPVKKRAS